MNIENERYLWLLIEYEWFYDKRNDIIEFSILNRFIYYSNWKLIIDIRNERYVVVFF